MDENRTEREKLIGEYLQKDEAVDWFEPFYAGADGDANAIPWAHQSPRRELLAWIRREQPQAEGRSALVIGCGLGDDAEALAERGYDVLAFDVSATAVQWCRERFPDSTVDYRVADLFQPPEGWLGAFDLVLEVYVVQALPPKMRRKTIEAVAAFVAPGGTLLAVGRGLDDGADAGQRCGPPWPLTHDELALFEAAGLQEVHFDIQVDASIYPVYRYRAEYRRPPGTKST